MKTYKLIRKYPECCYKIDDEVIENNNTYCSKDWKQYLNKTEVENWPEFWEQIKNPIFTTYDGFELFNESDVVFGVCPKGSWQTNYYSGLGVPIELLPEKISESWFYFSSKDACEKWIDENKPVFSKKMVRDALDKDINSLFGWTQAMGIVKQELGL
jgi:hypothetical protein